MGAEKNVRKVATYVRTLEDWNSDARLYKFDPPIAGAENVIVSAQTEEQGKASLVFKLGLIGAQDEVAFFPADENSEPAPTPENAGPFRRLLQAGTTDHAEAIAAIGYEVSA